MMVAWLVTSPGLPEQPPTGCATPTTFSGRGTGLCFMRQGWAEPAGGSWGSRAPRGTLEAALPAPACRLISATAGARATEAGCSLSSRVHSDA